MDDRLARVESQLHDLERELAGFDRRLTALERDHTIIATAGQAEADLAPIVSSFLPRGDVGATISFIGRTFVALGGAYLLRALTDSEMVPRPIGVAFGIVYGLAWLAAADRAGSRGYRLSAAFHALVACLVAFPLLWEATVRFDLLTPSASALALALFTATALGVAVRRNVQAVAWIATLGALPTAIAAISMTGALAPFAVLLIALGVMTLWIGYAWDWIWLRWPVALVADVAVLALTLAGAAGNPPQSPAVVTSVQMLLLNGYLASIVIRTIVRARDVIGFELLQALAALAVGFGGAVYIAERTGSGTALLAIINLIFGVACYAVGFVFMRQGRLRNFYFYSSLAIVLVITSATLLLSPDLLAIVSVLLAIVATWGAGRVSRTTLTVHGLTYLLTAGIASGLLAASTFALAAPVSVAWRPFGGAATLAVAGYAICWVLSAPLHDAPWAARIPRMLVAMLLVWTGTGALVAFFTSALHAGAGGAMDAGIVATVRTAILAAAAVGLAWTGQHERFRESAWLLYPVLVAGGIKLLVEDLPLSRPETLFVALAVYGLALIAAPRLKHHRTT